MQEQLQAVPRVGGELDDFSSHFLGIGKERTKDYMNRMKALGDHVSRPFLHAQWPPKVIRGCCQGQVTCWLVYRHDPSVKQTGQRFYPVRE